MSSRDIDCLLKGNCNMFLKGYPLEAKTAPKNWNQSVHMSWARLASFSHLGVISDPRIVSKFQNETHDPKGQENKIYTIVKGRETVTIHKFKREFRGSQCRTCQGKFTQRGYITESMEHIGQGHQVRVYIWRAKSKTISMKGLTPLAITVKVKYALLHGFFYFLYDKGALRIELKFLLRNRCARTFTSERLKLELLVGWQVNKNNSPVCSTSILRRRQKGCYKLHINFQLGPSNTCLFGPSF